MMFDEKNIKRSKYNRLGRFKSDFGDFAKFRPRAEEAPIELYTLLKVALCASRFSK